MPEPLKIYMAGELFDHKHLTGNLLLACHMDKIANGKYKCVLPQDLEFPVSRSVDIRNHDLKALMECDAGLFNFDGTELDSGTVVEFMFAKFIDLPAVIIRSDFRWSGDQGDCGDNWNLMCSGYPRTEAVTFNAMQWHHEARDKNQAVPEKTTSSYYDKIAKALIEAFDKAFALPSIFENSKTQKEEIYKWALRFPGGGFSELCGGDDFAKKMAAG